MSDYNCPNCGASLPPPLEGKQTACISSDCDWSGSVDDAAVDTSSPLDVQAQFGEVRMRVSEMKPPMKFSPNKAENLAEALEQAARRAREQDDGL